MAGIFYGGIGNRIRFTVGDLKKDIPIEPVGVIVLAIDGLRQDVLYAPPESNGGDVKASYSDPNGCGQNVSCNIQPEKLTGFCDVLGGKYTSISITSPCDPSGWENKHIKLKDVTAIFPSITVASWASVFTGKMPNETGILGNEFFARDLLNSKNTWNPDKASENVRVPDRYDNPAGMITFSSGALKGYDAFGFIPMLTMDFFMPYQGNWKERVLPERTPQNDTQLLTARTVYETINQDLPEVGAYFTAKGGDATVVSNNHYARGAYWLTWDIAFKWGESAIMDEVGWDKFKDYLGDGIFVGNYDKLNEDGVLVRNAVPFSAVTTWYLPGLDHQAHIKGMGAYTGYFKSTTDDYAYKLVKRLKKLDEFDNKIFIIVADHGMTSMPTNLAYPAKEKILGSIDDVVAMPAEMECKLKLDFSEPSSSDGPNQIIDAYNRREAERNNNNLHIWELGDALKALQKKKSALSYRVLATSEITGLFINAPAGARKNLDPQTDFSDYANVVAAFNGPMAHIYLKGQDWQAQPDAEELKKLAEVLRVLYQVEDSTEARNSLGIDVVRYLNLLENNVVRLKQSVDKILIRVGGQYLQFDGYGPNGYVLNQLGLGTEYVKASVRIPGMNDIKRSGDIVLVMKDNAIGPELNRYTTGVACKSWHGSLNSSDSYVPLIVAYPGGNKAELETYINDAEGCSVAQGCDGNWRVTDLIRSIIQKQYSSQ